MCESYKTFIQWSRSERNLSGIVPCFPSPPSSGGAQRPSSRERCAALPAPREPHDLTHHVCSAGTGPPPYPRLHSVVGSGSALMGSVAEQLAEKGIHADRDGLHLMPPDQLQQSVALQEECREFLSKTKQFNEIVADFITVMEGKSKARPPTAPQKMNNLQPTPTARATADKHRSLLHTGHRVTAGTPTAPQPNTRTGRRPDTHTDTHTHTDTRAHTGPEADTGARPISGRAAALASPALAPCP